MRIRDWSSDVCTSDLLCRKRRRQSMHGDGMKTHFGEHAAAPQHAVARQYLCELGERPATKLRRRALQAGALEAGDNATKRVARGDRVRFAGHAIGMGSACESPLPFQGGVYTSGER